MKKSLLLFTICFVIASCKTKTTREENIQEKKDTIQREFAFESKTDSVVTNGEQIYYHKSGAVEMRGIMKNNQRDGLWKSFYENGLPWSETTFKEGKKDGRTTTWYENGQKRYEGFFTNDLESGKWVYWHEDGTIAGTHNYDLK